ncbi:MAG: tRNA threonylcarbamoyladenosine dehydratase [Lachnospiraceae bacterium]|nr:tRNA threonylcarbamoyladenosine dehydratase [Lachnospiraceae bacterium]
MNNRFQRASLILGVEQIEKMNRSRVAVFGIGGVGGYTVEALVRTGVGHITIVDGDVVDETNINRQIVSTALNVGEAKTKVAKERFLSINPDADITALQLFYNAETKDMIDLSQFDYVVDAIDTVASKVELISEAYALGIPVISCMGAGNKTDPTRFKAADIYETNICPLAKIMRRELKARGISRLKVVFSTEQPVKPEPDEKGRAQIGSLASVVSVAGMIMANEVIMDLTNNK